MAGGENRGPCTREYVFAGFAFCQQVIYAKNAFATGIEFTELSVDVSGDVDPRGVLGIGDADPGFVGDEVTYTTRIQSPASPDEIPGLVGFTDHRCPAHAALRTPIEFDRELYLNGEPLEMD